MVCHAPFSRRRVFVEIRQFQPTPPAFDALVGGNRIQISSRSLESENYNPLAIVQIFSGILPLWVQHQLALDTDADRQTHIQTQGHSLYPAKHSLCSKNLTLGELVSALRITLCIKQNMQNSIPHFNILSF